MELSFLNSLGLNKNEILLYELLLKLGEVPVADLIHASKLKRPTLYKTLYSLEKKGLVTQKDIRKKIHFKPESPTLLLEQAENLYKSLERTKDSLQAVLPKLMSDFSLSVERPVVTTYEGIEGLKKIYLDTLKEGQLIHSFLQTAEVNEEMYQWLTNEYIKKRIKAKIHAKVIVASGKFSKEYTAKDIQELRITRVVDSAIYPIQHEAMIYANKVAFVNYKKGDIPLGVVIHHPHIATTMKAIFDLAWEGTNVR